MGVPVKDNSDVSFMNLVLVPEEVDYTLDKVSNPSIESLSVMDIMDHLNSIDGILGRLMSEEKPIGMDEKGRNKDQDNSSLCTSDRSFDSEEREIVRDLVAGKYESRNSLKTGTSSQEKCMESLWIADVGHDSNETRLWETDTELF